MRRLRLARSDAEFVVANPAGIDRDWRGRPRYLGYVRGLRVRVVVALDEPDLIVTIHPRRTG